MRTRSASIAKRTEAWPAPACAPRTARHAQGAAIAGLADELGTQEAALDSYWQQLSTGIDGGELRARPRELLALRIRMVELAMNAAQLELQALGGRSGLRSESQGSARGWREAAFLPVLAPTLAQLKAQCARADEHLSGKSI